MADNLAALNAFRQIARQGSFTRAAAELGVSASALSQSLRALEAHLGVRLLNRTTRHVGVTEAGRAFLERLGPALAEIDAAVDALRETQARPSGVLRLTVSRSAASMVLAPVMAAFMLAYPDITLDLDIENGLVDIVAAGFDAGIRLGEALHQDMVAVPVSAPIRCCVVGAPAYFARHGRPVSPADLQRHRCLRYRYVSSGGVYRWEFLDQGRRIEVAVEGPLIANDSFLSAQLAEAGAGLAYVFEPQARAALVTGGLETVLDAWMPPPDAFYLYTPSRSHMPPKLRVFIDFLRARMA